MRHLAKQQPYYYLSQLDVYPDNTGRRQSYSNSFIKVNEKSLDQRFFLKTTSKKVKEYIF